MNSQPEPDIGAANAAPMLTDIRRQPDVLRGLAARLNDIDAFCREHLVPGPDGRLIAFGSGDGWFAARSLAADGITPASGLEILGDVGPQLTSADRAIAISMSGNVDRTVEAAEVANNACGGAICLTNSEGGRLAELGLPNISLQLTDIAPFLCGTSSFLATRAMLGLFAGLNRGTPPDDLAAGLRATANVLEKALPDADSISLKVAQACAGAPGLRYLSCGPAGLAIADYGAAKIVELSGTPVWSDDIEEFAHRQFWTMSEGEVVVLLPTSPAVAGIAAESAKALRNMGVRSLTVAPQGMDTGGDWTFTWEATPGVDPLSMATAAMQFFGYHWAQATGFDPNLRMHLKNDTKRFKTSRMLTRRSLLAQAGNAKTAV
ncbi:MAG: hypothetical protein JJ902_04455 [Roseibium sp.]|nr:hypothetical protein [Roseibium sp.]